MTTGPFKTLHDRYRIGTFQRELPGGSLEFLLQEAVEDSKVVRIKSSELNELNELNTAPKQGQSVNLFLTTKTKTGGNWMGHLWPEEDNPWITRELPELGSEIFGIIKSFAQPYAAYLEIEHDGKTLTGFLDRRKLPEKQDLDITKVLFIGDKIYGTVENHDDERCNIDINVSDWVSSLRNRARIQAEAQIHSDADERAKSPELLDASLLTGKQIIYADDDKRLLEDVAQWLSSVGAEVKTVTKSGQLEAVLQEFTPTHALLDYKMPEVKDFEACIRLLKPANPHIAIFSGYGDSENFDPEPYNAGYLRKPARLDQITSWLQKPKPAKREDIVQDIQPAQMNDNWSLRQKQGDVISKAQDALDRMCERHELAGAAWFIEHAEGNYELRTCSPSVSEENITAVSSQIGHSVVAHAYQEGRLISDKLSPNDPLYREAFRVCGHMPPYFATLPVKTHNLSPRVIVFFSVRAFSKATLDSIKARQDHFELLIQYLQQEEHNDRIEAFATLGLSTTATLHEIRGKVQSLSAYPAALTRRLEAAEDIALLIARLNKDSSDLIELSQGSLRSLHKKQRMILMPVSVTQNVVNSMREIREKAFDRRHVNILFKDYTPERLRTHISPIALEQALINLIGNALSLVPNEDWAQITVSVAHARRDTQHSIHIDVADNGNGMTAPQMLRLFEARATSKDYGTGLGLFISRGLIRSLGGDLTLIDSARWGGTRFRIALPVILGDHANT